MDFGEVIVRSAWVLIPLFALAIPLIAVIGAVIVRPISQAIARLAESDRASLSPPAVESQLREMDDRLARIERQLHRLLPEPDAPRPLEPGLHRTVSTHVANRGSRADPLRY